MDKIESLNHTKWDCKCHVVFMPKNRRKVLYRELRDQRWFRTLAQHKESRIEEGHLLADHVHMMISIPPKYAVSNVVGYIKGKSAIHLARVYAERKRNFVGQHFWARGHFASTVGRDEEVIRNYILPPSRRMRSWSSLGCGDKFPPYRWLKEWGPRKRPRLAALSGTQL